MKRLLGILFAILAVTLLPTPVQATGTKLGTLLPGSKVKIAENGVYHDYTVIQQGYPTLGNGNTLIMRDNTMTLACEWPYFTVTYYSISSSKSSPLDSVIYEESSIDNFLNSHFLTYLDASIRDEIVEVNVVTSRGTNPRKGFLLSLTELGFFDPAAPSTSYDARYFPVTPGSILTGFAMHPEILISDADYITRSVWYSVGLMYGRNVDTVYYYISTIKGVNTSGAMNDYYTFGKQIRWIEDDSSGYYTTPWTTNSGMTAFRPAFCLPADMNVATDGRIVVDADPPVITDIDVPQTWSKQLTVTVTAQDDGSGVAEYAIGSTEDAPASGWQAGNTFSITQNGSYFAFAKDGAGNISVAIPFEVGHADAERPVVNTVMIPDSWVSRVYARISATDSISGVEAYALSQTSIAPSYGWQAPNLFEITDNGNYYAWARDVAGNISPGHTFTVSTIDGIPPRVNAVSTSGAWGAENIATINAADDETGVVEYAVSQENTLPAEGWQSSNQFSVNANGTWYAWARDAVGNTSASRGFFVSYIDDKPPVISSAVAATNWGADNLVTITAADAQTGIVGYAISTLPEAPENGWQASNEFYIAQNGTYYAFAKDAIGNISSPRAFNVSFVDSMAPVLGSVLFNYGNTAVTVTATDSGAGVASITVNDVTKQGSYASFELAEGSRYLRISATDRAGIQSETQTVRVPGWYDELATLTLLPVQFDMAAGTATITGQSTKKAVAGIGVNSTYTAKNPLVYTLTANDKYLELYAQDVDGDRSPLYRVRVPGWTEIIDTLAITQVAISADATTAIITATETVGKGVAGIYVNGEFFEGNPVAYDIPQGTRHLELQAQNAEGDRSAVVTRRVPGWSDVVTTLTITDVSFTDYNTKARITALGSGGSTVAGIEVNGTMLEGNPVVYTIPKGTAALTISAVNTAGDRSPGVTKEVPRDATKSTMKLTIDRPGWTNAEKVRVRVNASDKLNIVSVMARTAEDEWSDVTDSRYIYIREDTTVYASAENEQGDVKDAELDIICFDREAPTVSAVQDGEYINILASDNKSGIDAIFVNNKEYRDSAVYGGRLYWSIPNGTTSVVVRAKDKAGNLSQTVELGVKMLLTAVPAVTQQTPPPEPTPPVEPDEMTVPDPEPLPEPAPEEPQEQPGDTLPAKAGATGEQDGLDPVATAAAAGVGIAALSVGAWWHLRMRRLRNMQIPELEIAGRQIQWDESEYRGPIDPESKTIQVDFKAS